MDGKATQATQIAQAIVRGLLTEAVYLDSGDYVIDEELSSWQTAIELMKQYSGDTDVWAEVMRLVQQRLTSKRLLVKLTVRDDSCSLT